jgi:hypothetical protein
MVDDMDTTKQSLIPRPFVTLSYAQTLDGRIEFPGTLPMSVENEERAGCVTVS